MPSCPVVCMLSADRRIFGLWEALRCLIRLVAWLTEHLLIDYCWHPVSVRNTHHITALIKIFLEKTSGQIADIEFNVTREDAWSKWPHICSKVISLVSETAIGIKSSPRSKMPLLQMVLWCIYAPSATCQYCLLIILLLRYEQQFLSSLVPWQLRVTVWSLCTKAVSYIKYPKACQKGKYEDYIFLFLCMWLMSMFYPEYLRTGPLVLLPQHAPWITYRPLPYGATLGVWPNYGPLYWQLCLFSKGGMLFITDLSAAWGNDCLWLSCFFRCTTMPLCDPRILITVI